MFDNVPVLAGQCLNCLTSYYADHEHSPGTENNPTRLYLNSVKLLKVRTQVWVDHRFTHAVLNATYNFHGSTSAFVAFWNMSFRSEQDITLSCVAGICSRVCAQSCFSIRI